MIEGIPRAALSVRQPWAWAIIHGGKDIENRSWRTGSPDLNMRGRIAIHASRGITQDEYWEARSFMTGLGVKCPEPHGLLRGGIIGTVDIADIVSVSKSRWFFGPKGLVLRDPKPCEFIPARGQLGFFRPERADASSVPEPVAWMLPKKAREPKPAAPAEPDLFGQ